MYKDADGKYMYKDTNTCIKMLMAIFVLVQNAAHSSDTTKVSPVQEFMVTIAKLWLNCQDKITCMYHSYILCYCVMTVF